MLPSPDLQFGRGQSVKTGNNGDWNKNVSNSQFVEPKQLLSFAVASFVEERNLTPQDLEVGVLSQTLQLLLFEHSFSGPL